MIRAEYACIIPVTLHLKGILLGNSSLRGFGCCFCVVFFCPPPCHMCNKMSDVRLSNASPTLERVDARQPDNPRPPVRRNLFGSPDREELHRYLADSMQGDVQAFRDNYNFDPVTDTPLAPGNYEWQAESNPPEFFLRPPHGSQRPRPDADLPVDDNRQLSEEGSGRQPDRPADGEASSKRRSGELGSCSSECQSKRSRTDEDDDEDQSGSAGNQEVSAAEERPSRPENGAEGQ